jgi:hypothetical protein
MVLTSKQTGKKMEIRFKFDHKSVQSKWNTTYSYKTEVHLGE